jgi:hypothetical protein
METELSQVSRHACGTSSLLRASTGEAKCVVLRIVAKIGRAENVARWNMASVELRRFC